MSSYHATVDFTNDSNYGSDPRRAEQLRIASTIDLDQIDVPMMGQPAGAGGFRRGMWMVRYRGKEYRFYASVSHYADLDKQERMVRIDAALHIAGVESGYVRA